jgi:hypothetical protein
VKPGVRRSERRIGILTVYTGKAQYSWKPVQDADESLSYRAD